MTEATTEQKAGEWYHDRGTVYVLNEKGVNRIWGHFYEGQDDNGVRVHRDEAYAAARRAAAAPDMLACLQDGGLSVAHDGDGNNQEIEHKFSDTLRHIAAKLKSLGVNGDEDEWLLGKADDIDAAVAKATNA